MGFMTFICGCSSARRLISSLWNLTRRCLYSNSSTRLESIVKIGISDKNVMSKNEARVRFSVTLPSVVSNCSMPIYHESGLIDFESEQAHRRSFLTLPYFLQTVLTVFIDIEKAGAEVVSLVIFCFTE